MFRHLLVPLDGSGRAERALPAAAAVARALGAAVTLVHVVERNAPASAHGERHLAAAAEAAVYLADAARRPELAGLRVGVHVHEAEARDIARAIVEHTEELAPDLVVMTTHGRGGPRRIVLGSIAQQVIAMGRIPVLLVGAEGGMRAGVGCILAPIDGDPSHEQGLPAAAALARAFGARVDLLMVVPTVGKLAGARGAAGRLMPGAARVLLEMDSEAAAAHLQAREKELAGQGIAATHEAVRGEPAAAIVSAARRRQADLVVMATHGRAGTGAFWAGSVAHRVVSRLGAPLLLVPLPDPAR